ncbi:hypothetical protein BDV59DRAFT_99353 [Aspergillus ambiguus]|uniref:uncharacterized protein n=1 Tax=Aspergillus ambiguus TaxID=176160 RepID=UPI003CCE5246
MRCKRTGRKCDGYRTPPPSALSQELVSGTPATIPGESRALEIFFIKASPRLAGYFEDSFWRYSVLQLSLSEPAIRQALAAIGSVYEHAGSSINLCSSISKTTQPRFPLLLYNKAIQSVIAKASDTDAIPVVIVASILFACLEFLRGEAVAASTHIDGGIKLLQKWRQHDGEYPKGQPWPQTLSSFQSHFIETELAPILSLFNINSSEFNPVPRSRIILNGIDDQGLIVIAPEFQTLREARVAFTDIVTTTVSAFQRIDESLKIGKLPDLDLMILFNGIQSRFHRWEDNFRNLRKKQQGIWNTHQKNAAAVLRIMWISAIIGIRSYLTEAESDWDAYRTEYEEVIELIETLLSDSNHYPDELSKTLSLDSGLIFPLHGVAWKCRWPCLRRKGLNLLLRMPKREWLLEAEQYHVIFSRIMELEEMYARTGPGLIRDGEMLPPEHARIHDFYCESLPHDPSLIAITFVTKPHGLDKEWHFETEYLSLQALSDGGTTLPSNLISCKPWASPWMTDPHIGAAVKTLMFGDYKRTPFHIGVQ